MEQPKPETGHEAEDPVRTMGVQRVQRSDGRYLIYYDWPDAGGEGEGAADRLAEGAEHDV